MSVDDAAADLREALGAARLSVASNGASDLLSRANAMIKASSKPWSRAPIAKRPPAARKTAGGKKKPCKIA